MHAWRQQRARRARRAESHGRPTDRKAWQLCRQVAVTLDEVLAECGDGVLRGLHVVSVAPFPDASRLLVTLTSIDDRPGEHDRGRERAGTPRARHRPPALRDCVGRHPQTCAGLALPVGRAQGGRDRDRFIRNK